jgi:hypothetical protein
MLALFQLIPIKDWIYAGIIAGLIAFGWYYTVHERDVGKAQIVALDTRLADQQKAHVADLQTEAAKTSAAVEAQYESDSDTLSTPAPSVVCVTPTRRSVPATASRSGGASQSAQQGISAPISGGDDSIDIGPPLTLAGHKSDVQVTALQADVQLLVTEMLNANKTGK